MWFNIRCDCWKSGDNNRPNFKMCILYVSKLRVGGFWCLRVWWKCCSWHQVVRMIIVPDRLSTLLSGLPTGWTAACWYNCSVVHCSLFFVVLLFFVLCVLRLTLCSGFGCLTYSLIRVHGGLALPCSIGYLFGHVFDFNGIHWLVRTGSISLLLSTLLSGLPTGWTAACW